MAGILDTPRVYLFSNWLEGWKYLTQLKELGRVDPLTLLATEWQDVNGWSYKPEKFLKFRYGSKDYQYYVSSEIPVQKKK